MAEQGPLSGQKLGDKYLLGELIGQGGFGVVYRAQHLLLNRSQAIKILLEQHFSNPKFRERFLREAQTLATLDSPAIVPIHDFGIEGSRAYLVMPYLSGGTLHDVLKKRAGPLGLDEVSRYLEQMCAGLGYAHARNVVHLDLKPLNLLLHPDGRLVLSDFGLAHLMKEGAAEGGSSLQFGSPYYMAPEHFDGQPGQRSDLYALGIILYQMLVGRVPFDGPISAVMRKHLMEPPPPLRATRPDLPVGLESVIQKALAKKPEERYGRPGEMVVDFKEALAGQAQNPALATTIRAQHPPVAEPAQVQNPALASTVRAQNPPTPPASDPLPATQQASLPLPQLAPKPPDAPAAPPLISSAKPPTAETGVSGKAVASLILALLALGVMAGFIIGAFVLARSAGACYDSPDASCFSYEVLWNMLLASLLAFLPGIPALSLSRTALRQIRASNGRLTGLRAAETALVLAWIIPGDWVAMLLWKLLKLIGTVFHLIAQRFLKDDEPRPGG